MNNFYKLFIVLLISLLLGCGNKGETPQERPHSGARVETVIVEVVALRNLNEYIRLTGILEGKTDISFNSEISGRIVEVFKRLGDSVEIGEAIGRIDNTDLEIQVTQAEAAVLAAEANLLSANILYLSSSELFESEMISSVEYHNNLSNFKNAQATLQGAKANLESRQRALHNSQFFAPVAGRIVDLPIRVGQSISAGQKIAGIVDIETLTIRTGVGENAIRAISSGQTVNVTNRNNNSVQRGRIVGIGLKPLANIATYPIEIEIENRNNNLLPGMVVNCEILSFVNRNVVYTLLSNVLREYDTEYVYVVDAENIVHRRNVKTGKQISENIIIESGLSAGDRLIVDGHERVRDGSIVTIRNFD